MSKNQEFVKFDKVDKSYDGKVLVVKDLNPLQQGSCRHNFYLLYRILQILGSLTLNKV